MHQLYASPVLNKLIIIYHKQFNKTIQSSVLSGAIRHTQVYMRRTNGYFVYNFDIVIKLLSKEQQRNDLTIHG